MKEMEQILAELSSDDPIKRHDACEELRVAEKLPDHGKYILILNGARQKP